MRSDYGYDSPLGPLRLSLTRAGAIAAIGYGAGAPALPDGHPVRRRFDGYFTGSSDLDGLPVDLDVTPFQRAVLEAIRSIPRGEVRSYAWVAARVGKPGAARAVGQALGANPAPIVVPCHRVVGAAGLGGYTGGVDRKRALLEIEGALSRSPAAPSAGVAGARPAPRRDVRRAS